MKQSAHAPLWFAALAMLLASSELGCSKKTPDGREILIQSEEPSTSVERSLESAGTGTGPLAQMNELIARKRIDTHAPGWRTNLPRPPTIRFPKDRKLYWNIETNLGLMKIELYPDQAPKHVSTTMYLTQLGFYDTLTFHRIVPKFMAQGGDPQGDGSGGPGFTYGLEIGKRPHKHDERGAVSAANAGPNTDGSQFFILFGERAEHLDGKHTVFGQLVQGQGTLTSIEMAGTESGKPRTRVFIERAWITEVLD